MICWFESSSNNTSRNGNFVFLISGISSGKSGLPILKENFREFMGLSLAKYLPKAKWERDYDSYLMPNAMVNV